MEENDLSKVKIAYDIINIIGKQQDTEMFSKAGKKVIESLISKNEKQLNLLRLVEQQMDSKFSSWKEEIREMIQKDKEPEIEITEDEQKFKNSIEKYIDSKLESIGKHVQKVKEEQKKTQYIWKKKEDTDEITRLVCSNGHSITITKSPEGELLGRIDNNPNKKINKDEVSNLKREAEKLEPIKTSS